MTGCGWLLFLCAMLGRLSSSFHQSSVLWRGQAVQSLLARGHAPSYGASSRMQFSAFSTLPAASSSRSTPSTPSKPVSRPGSSETGAFKRRLPDLFEAPTHYKRALRTLKTLRPDASIKNVRNQQRKLCAQTLDRLGQSLTKPITEIIDSYRQIFRDIHPFERTVADLVVQARQKVGLPDLEFLLGELKELRVATSKIAKDHASRASDAASATEAKELLASGMTLLEELYSTSALAASLNQLVELQKELRKIPVVELGTPTVVLVGAPNVGKSSLVRVVSTGTPEVNDYPFTTRGVTIGHVINKEKQIRFQVMDTPGLLDRPQEERNEMERLTFASLAHLPTAVIFVVDPSGMSGEQSSLEKQLNVRAMLRQRFPRRPWLDVVSKGDLKIPKSITEKIRSRGADDFLQVSVESGLNVEELRSKMEALFEDLSKQLAEREAGMYVPSSPSPSTPSTTKQSSSPSSAEVSKLLLADLQKLALERGVSISTPAGPDGKTKKLLKKDLLQAVLTSGGFLGSAAQS